MQANKGDTMSDTKSCSEQGVQSKEQELEALGFTQASKNLATKKALGRKLMVAYEHYRFVTPELINKFQDELRKKTYQDKKDRYSYPTYDTLRFTDVSQYAEVPPAEALEALKLAKSRQCFDYFEVAKV